MNKWKERAGFTLAELLIVVAIIAILVAIGVPAFSTAMERSRETVDLANIRGAYAEFMADSLSGTYTKGSYPITVKQRDSNSWIIDTSGFQGNISGDFSVPQATDKYVVFVVSGTGEKPTCTYESGTPTGTQQSNGAYLGVASEEEGGD